MSKKKKWGTGLIVFHPRAQKAEMPLKSRHTRKVTVASDCSGTPGGCIEIHIENVTPPDYRWEEAHLSLQESRMLRYLLKNAERDVRRQLREDAKAHQAEE